MKTSIQIFFVVWISLLLFAFAGLNVYAAKPGEGAQPNFNWPSDSGLAKVAGQSELLLFLHPQCSCSRATLSELERLMPSIAEKAHVTLIFFKPEGQTQAWTRSSLWEKAKAIPGVVVLEDEHGAEAKKFSVKTSGQVILFDSKGQLAFAGGITPARGHEGDSAGGQMIRSLVGRDADRSVATSSVFGCSLFSPLKKLAGVLL